MKLVSLVRCRSCRTRHPAPRNVTSDNEIIGISCTHTLGYTRTPRECRYCTVEAHLCFKSFKRAGSKMTWSKDPEALPVGPWASEAGTGVVGSARLQSEVSTTRLPRPVPSLGGAAAWRGGSDGSTHRCAHGIKLC